MMNFPLYTIGGGVKHASKLLDFFIQHKVYLDTSHKLFNSVYDSIFGLRWNGGRICNPKDFLVLSDVFELIHQYNILGIGFNWSFSNLLLTEEDMKDDYCNLALEGSNNSLNGVILTSDILRKYVRENYPNMKIIYSVCNGLKTIDEYKKALDENDLVVLHPDFNHDYNFLQQLPEKERIEVMINDVCSFGCPFRYQHYKQLSEYCLKQSRNPIIMFPEEIDSTRNKGCMAIQNGYTKDKRNKLSFSDIDYLLNMGFKHFKIIGREHEWDDYFKTDLDPNLNQYFLRKIIKETNLDLHI